LLFSHQSHNEALKNDEAYVAHYLALEKEYHDHTSVTIFDEEGKTIFSAGPPIQEIELAAPVLSALQGGQGRALPGMPLRSRKEGLFIFPIYVPLFDGKDDGLKGVLATYMDVESYFEKAALPYTGDTGHINLVDSDGTVIYDPIMRDDAAPFSRRVMKKIKEQGKGWFTDIDEHGIESVIAFHPLKYVRDKKGPSKLYTVLTQPTSEAFYEPIKEVLFGAAVPGFFLASLLIFIIYLTLKRIVKPFDVLKEGAAIIGKGGLNHRIDIKTGDEVEELSQAFNKMVAEIDAQQEQLLQNLHCHQLL